MNPDDACKDTLDPYQRPPSAIKDFYKSYQKASLADIDSDPNVLDLGSPWSLEQSRRLNVVGHIHAETIEAACSTFDGQKADQTNLSNTDLAVYECTSLPGLLLIKSLLPQQTQRSLVSRLLHDTLADWRHKTNVDVHYELPRSLLAKNEATECMNDDAKPCSQRRRPSFFDLKPTSKSLIQPIDPTMHRPYTVSQFLHKKLRWIDLGGQYDWSKKLYDTANAPAFPDDIAQLMRCFFPETKSEVAIVNLYSPGDTLSVHRDVSESSTNGLISISLGCDAIFIIGLEREHGRSDNLAIRLRSGDVVYMSKSARFAWHGVPQIIPETCPAHLSDWPGELADKPAQDNVKESKYEAWRGWMSTKRINLNIRQLNDDS